MQLKGRLSTSLIRLAFVRDGQVCQEAVLTQYRSARVDLDERGMTLRRSPSPVPRAPMLIASR